MRLLAGLALMLISGGAAISGFAGLPQLAPVTGPVRPAPAVRRALAEAGELRRARGSAAVTGFTAGQRIHQRGGRRGPDRRAWTGLWLTDAGPLRRTEPWPPALLAVYLEGRTWEFCGGWSGTGKGDGRHRAAARGCPDRPDRPGRRPADDRFVADLAGLPGLGAGQDGGLRMTGSWRTWPGCPAWAPGRRRSPACGSSCRTSRRTPAAARGRPDGRQSPAAAASSLPRTPAARQVAWPGARRRCHVHVENNLKQAKDPGLNRWPPRHRAINVAWTQVVALVLSVW